MGGEEFLGLSDAVCFFRKHVLMFRKKDVFPRKGIRMVWRGKLCGVFRYGVSDRRVFVEVFSVSSRENRGNRIWFGDGLAVPVGETFRYPSRDGVVFFCPW